MEHAGSDRKNPARKGDIPAMADMSGKNGRNVGANIT